MELAHHLVARGLVTPEQVRAAELRRRGGDPRPLLDLLASGGGVDRAQLAAAAAGLEGGGSRRGAPPVDSRGSGPRAVWTPGPDSRGRSTSAPDAGGPGAAGAELREGARIQVGAGLDLRCIRVVGQGGMGVVHLVEDVTLGRPAALKVMRAGGGLARVRRFLREAEVTARLDHPGIPPVFATGRTPGGHPFFLMRYVAGESLEERLGGGPAAAEEARRELLEALVKVAEAVAYAHSRGIVHRDLKPANLMLGAFGEVLVMDWGLARVLAQSSSEDAALRRELQGDDGLGDLHLTREGAVLGSLGYMSPEQARGEDVDPRADVFALGAILVRVLTGAAPLTGAGPLEVLARTNRGEVELPRRRDASVPRELDAIAARALAAAREERYAGAEDFARDLKAYLEGRAVSVYRYGAGERTWRAVRRHPTLFAALAAGFVVSLLAVLAVARARVQATAGERERTVAEARRAAERAREALERGTEEPPVGRAALEERHARALAAFTAAQRWHALAPGEEAAARARFEAAMELGEVARAGEQWTLAGQAFADAAALGVDAARAEAALARVEEERTAETRRREREVGEVLARARAGELLERPDAYREALLRLARLDDPATAARLLDELREASAALGEVVRAAYLEGAAEAGADEAAVAAALELLLRPAPAALAPEQAAAFAEAERSLRRRLGRGQVVSGHAELHDPRERVQAHLAARQEATLGGGRLQAARLAAEVLGLTGPAEAGELLGRYLLAEHDERRAVAPALALCRVGGEAAAVSLGRALQRFGPVSLFARRIRPAVVGAGVVVHEGSAAWGADAATSAEQVERLAERANLAVGSGDAERAVALYTEVLERVPDHPVAWSNRGYARMLAGDLEGARADLDRAVAIDPALSLAFSNRGHLFSRLGEQREALADFDRALELDPRDASALAGRAQTRRVLGDPAGAIEDAGRALALDPQRAEAYAVRAGAAYDQGDPRRAVSDLTRAIELDPTVPRFFNWRGVARRSLGDVQGALEDYARALELAPDDTQAWCDRAVALLDLGSIDEARESLGRALELDPRSAKALALRGGIHLTQGEYDEALAACQRAVELDRRQALGWKFLGQTLLLAGRAAEAAPALDRALALPRCEADALLYRALARVGLGEVEPARADLRALLERAPGDREACYWLAALGEPQATLEALAASADPWAAAVASFFLGRTPGPQLLRLAEAARDPELARSASCKAHGWIALRAELEGDVATARRHYRACVATGASSLSTYLVARERLRRLGDGE